MSENEHFRPGYRFQRHGSLKLEKRETRHALILATSILLLAVLLVVSASVPFSMDIHAKGVVVTSSADVLIFADSSGQILERTRPDGTHVGAGDEILLFHTPTSRDTITDIQSGLALATQELKLMDEKISVLEASLSHKEKWLQDATKADLILAQEISQGQSVLSKMDDRAGQGRIKRLYRLYEEGVLTETEVRKEIDTALSTLSRMSIAYHEQLDKVSRLEKEILTAKQEIIEIKKARVGLHSTINASQQKLESFAKYGTVLVHSMRATVEGTLHYLLDSDYVHPGQPLAVIKRERQASARKVILTTVPLSQKSEIFLDQVAYIKPPTGSGVFAKPLEGRVRELTPMTDGVTFKALIEVADPQNQLPSFSAVTLRLESARQKLVDHLFKQ